MISKKLLGVAIAATLAGCTAVENYRFGDITRAALETAAQVNALKADYCSTPNGPSRGLILATIRRVDPEYVGVCDVAP